MVHKANTEVYVVLISVHSVLNGLQLPICCHSSKYFTWKCPIEFSEWNLLSGKCTKESLVKITHQLLILF